MRTSTLLLAALLLAAPPAIAAAPPAVDDILRELERIMEITTDVRARVVMTQQKASQGVKVIEMTYYRRDKDDAFLIVMRAPEAERGNGYLRVGDNFWMYRRNTRTFQHVNRDESIGGSDARADDFEKRKLTELYAGARDAGGAELIREALLGKIPCWEIEIAAKVRDVDYPKKRYWLRKSDYLPLKEESYSLSGTLMQTAYYLLYASVEGHYVPVKQLFIDEFEKENRTMVEIGEISIAPLEEGIFTKAHLENLSK